MSTNNWLADFHKAQRDAYDATERVADLVYNLQQLGIGPEWIIDLAPDLREAHARIGKAVSSSIDEQVIQAQEGSATMLKGMLELSRFMIEQGGK